MLDVMRRGQRWIMPALLIGISVPFVAYFGFQSGNSAGTTSAPGIAIRVGDREVSVEELQRSVDQQLQRFRESLGAELDERNALPFVVEQAKNGKKVVSTGVRGMTFSGTTPRRSRTR